MNAPARPLARLAVLAVGLAPERLEALAAEGFDATAGTDPAAAGAFDAVLCAAGSHAALAGLVGHPRLAQTCFDRAVLVETAIADDALEAELLRLGVEAIVAPAPAGATARAVRHAVLRKQVERSARTAYATDLATGLPHEAQLLEHMTQLIALREREPAAMVLLALRVEGVDQAAARLGGEAANVLRRKVAVRLRAGLRASDVVAAIGPDTFGVLLGHLEAAADGERVAAKLVRALQQPIVVAGQPCRVAAVVGLAQFPAHGKEAVALLRRACAQAAHGATPAVDGRAGAQPRGTAANDALR